MKILNAKLHGIIDYVSVAGLLLAPSLFGLHGVAATFAYVLAGIHLLSANGRMFDSAFGAVLLAVWAVTDYGTAPATAGSPS